jgi:hypothetical protein
MKFNKIIRLKMITIKKKAILKSRTNYNIVKTLIIQSQMKISNKSSENSSENSTSYNKEEKTDSNTSGLFSFNNLLMQTLEITLKTAEGAKEFLFPPD